MYSQIFNKNINVFRAVLSRFQRPPSLQTVSHPTQPDPTKIRIFFDPIRPNQGIYGPNPWPYLTYTKITLDGSRDSREDIRWTPDSRHQRLRCFDVDGHCRRAITNVLRNCRKPTRRAPCQCSAPRHRETTHSRS